MKYYILFLFAFIFTTPAFAQPRSLSGTVKFSDGKPVQYATVGIKELDRYMQTDKNGRFEFKGLRPGRYEIAVTSVEIENRSFTVEHTRHSAPLSLVVEAANIVLKGVQVQTNSEKREIETAGFAVNVVETQKYATQSIQTNELLDRTTGVRIRQDGGMGSKVKYNINGLSGNAVKIFIDGVPSSNYGSSFSLNSLPPALIERIEVYKGVVPGYLAEDALGGAINVVLKKRRDNSLVVSYSGGSFNTHQGDLTGSYRWKNGLTFEGSAFYNYSDNNYKVWGDDIFFKDYNGTITESDGKRVRRFHDAYESVGGKFNFGVTDVKWADQFLIGAVLSKDYREVQNGITMRVVYGDRHSKRRSNVLTLVYEKKDLLLKGLTLKVDAGYSSLRRQVIDTVGIMYDWVGPIKYPDGSYVKYNSGAENGDSQTALIDREYTTMVRANLSYRIHRNHTVYANWLFNDFKRKSSDKYQPAALQKLKNTRDQLKDVFSFTYENLAFGGRLRTNLFYKYYYQKVTSNEPYRENNEYKLNVIHKNIDDHGYGLTFSLQIVPNLYLLGSAERTLRLPTAHELFGNEAENVQAAYTTLKPEQSYNANLGFNYRHRVNEHSFGINASVYFRDTRGMIREAIQSGRYEESKFENLEKVLTKGIDAEIDYNYADRLSFRFNISKFDVLFNTKYDARGDRYQYYREQIRNEPSLKFSSGVTYFHNDLFLKESRASVHVNINYVEGFLRIWANAGSSNLPRIPTQYPVSAGITYAFPKNKVVLSFDVKNILNDQVYDNYGLQKPGRAFYGKLTYFIF